MNSDESFGSLRAVDSEQATTLTATMQRLPRSNATWFGLRPIEASALVGASALVLLLSYQRWSPISVTEAWGFVTGGICVWLVVREHMWNWPIGLANNVFFFVLFLQSRLFADINRTKPHARQTADALKEVFDRENVRHEWVETLPPQRNLYRKMADLRDRKVDLAIAVGGEGTLLQAAHRFRGSSVPILGINIGYLGFITSIHGERVRREMKRVLNAEFIISKRTALDLEIRNGRKRMAGWALNDALITRGSNPHVIGVKARIGDRRLTSYRCDGLIIATPTGRPRIHSLPEDRSSALNATCSR